MTRFEKVGEPVFYATRGGRTRATFQMERIAETDSPRLAVGQTQWTWSGTHSTGAGDIGESLSDCLARVQGGQRFQEVGPDDPRAYHPQD